jgi:uncharacterized protein (DUF169 family)/Pyruvate/2-oxoacid:ferredoxin oxidoreductase delta subunit
MPAKKTTINQGVSMPFAIDQKLCLGCGSCIGNCPNRAIIRRGEQVIITDMCSDCGVCLSLCAIRAIGRGRIRAELDSRKLAEALKLKLGLSKNIAAMKFYDEPPEGIPREKGPHFWCGMCGDVFDTQEKPLFFTSEASTCGGCVNLGLRAPNSTREEFETATNASVVGEGNLYRTKDIMTKNRNAFPQYKKRFAGIVIGSLEQVEMPNLVIFPINAHQLCMISTAYAFETGELIMGIAGKAACLMSVPTPLLENKPIFLSGDHGGRMFMRLAHDELLLCFPFSLIPGLVKNLDRTVFAQE